ncbi:MAG: oxygen-independent coproporphyrinogen-3 oxidase, partial [Maricaulis sp.]
RHQKLIHDADLPGSGARIEQALAIADAVQTAGYSPIGIDHYARASDAMARLAASGEMRRNFQGYTTDQAAFLVGLGASAISQTPDGYAQNTADVASWSRAIEAGELATARGVRQSGEDRIRGEIIERLMCDLQADPGAIAAQFGGSIEQPDLADLVADGVVSREGARICIADAYRTLARVVAARFDAYLQASAAARHSVSV